MQKIGRSDEGLSHNWMMESYLKTDDTLEQQLVGEDGISCKHALAGKGITRAIASGESIGVSVSKYFMNWDWEQRDFSSPP